MSFSINTGVKTVTHVLTGAEFKSLIDSSGIDILTLPTNVSISVLGLNYGENMLSYSTGYIGELRLIESNGGRDITEPINISNGFTNPFSVDFNLITTNTDNAKAVVGGDTLRFIGNNGYPTQPDTKHVITLTYLEVDLNV